MQYYGIAIVFQTYGPEVELEKVRPEGKLRPFWPAPPPTSVVVTSTFCV